MAKLVDGDACRVSLSIGCVDRRYQDHLMSDPWWTEDDHESILNLKWFREKAPTFITEFDFSDYQTNQGDGAEAENSQRMADAVCYEKFIRLPTPELAAEFVTWLTEIRHAWQDRHALVSEGCPAYCDACGGPMDSIRDTTKTNRIQDIEIEFTSPNFWCDHCGNGDHSVSSMSGNRSWTRYFEITRIIRSHLGLVKGQRQRTLKDLPGCASSRI